MHELLRALFSACCGEAFLLQFVSSCPVPVCKTISFPLFLFKNHTNSTSSDNYRLPHSSFTNYDTSRCLKSIKTCCLHPYFYWATYSVQPCLSRYQGLHAQMVKCRFAVTTRLVLVMPGLGLAKISRLNSAVEEATYVSLFLLNLSQMHRNAAKTRNWSTQFDCSGSFHKDVRFSF